MDQREYRKSMKARAVSMRGQPTPAEQRLWTALSGSKTGYKFRRQKIIDNGICDIFCPAKNAAVEVDGETHSFEEDQARDAQLAKFGISVLHVTNRDVMTNIEGVVLTIVHWLDGLPDRWPPHPNPSPEGEGLR